MQACHWKAHNTFTNFYLKDLTWSDNDNYVSGTSGGSTTSPRPFPSDQVSSERKEGGAHPLQPSPQESNPRGLGIGLPLKMLRVRSF